MFTQKYQKQLLSLLPLVQQQGQQQSVQPSNKYNSNDEQQCEEECFTPNYNVVQDEVEKKDEANSCCAQKEEDNKGEESESRYRSSENYRMMRENGLDYEKWMRRGFDLADNMEQKSVVIRDQKMMGSGQYHSLGHQESHRSVGYQKGHQLSPSLSSFQNLIDSGMNSHTNNDPVNAEKPFVAKLQKFQAKPEQSKAFQPIKSPNNSQKIIQNDRLSIKTYQQIKLNNGDILTQETLKTNPSLRLQLIKQLITLIGHDNTPTQAPYPQHIISFSDIPVRSSSQNNKLLEQFCEQNENDRVEFWRLEKVIEEKCAQIIDSRMDQVKDERRKRERQQVLGCDRYRKLTGKQYERYEQRGVRSLRQLQCMVDRQLSQFVSKISQQYRIQCYKQTSSLQNIAQSLSTISTLTLTLKSQHQSNITNILTLYLTQYEQLQQQLQILSEKISSMSDQLEQKLEGIGQLVEGIQLGQQPNDQGERQMMGLLRELEIKVWVGEEE